MKRTLLLITVFLTTFFSFAQVPTIERDALIALYNATDGANWANNTNWNTAQPVSSWYGVTVENVTGGDHVTSINFGYSNNNLNGTLPEEIGDLTEITSINIRYNSLLTGTIPHSIGNLINLKFLYLYNNNLSGEIPAEIVNLSQIEKLGLSNNNFYGAIPDLTSLTNLTRFYIWNNYFQFADFENEFNDYIALTTSNNGNFYYHPMKKLEMEIVEDIVIGNNYSFSMPSVSGAGVTYQWYKNDVIISGETGQTFTITNAQLSDIGNYTCKASSPIVTNLTIDRNTIHIYDTVLQSDKDALIALYNATDGANWMNNTNWNTTAPVYEWYGVEMEGNRVSSINLSNNNLVGSLPTEIGDLVALKNLDLSYNQLAGNIPSEIGNLTNIKNLFLNFNQLSGNIPSSIGNLTMLKDLEMWNNQLTGTIPSSVGNLINLEILTFEYNQLTGSVPASFSNLTAMESFWLNNNQLTGNVDNIFTNMSNLYYVSISDNQIEGNIDLSNNSDLYGYWFNNNLLNSIDVRNGNNNNTSYFYAENNPDLTCIFVDDTNYSSTNWTNIDATTHFVETQAQCDDFYTYVPDDNFEQALIDLGYDDILDDYVLTSNISSITTLDVDGLSITDLTGIEDFIGLTELICWNNSITSLDVTNNVNLIDLYTAGNPLGTLDVSQNTMLEVLYCGYNQLSTLDLSNNPNLKQLGCRNNNLSSLDLSQNSNLFYLLFSDNSLTSINVTNLNLLQHLVFDNNQISTIDLSNNLALTGFFCQNNQLTEIDISQNQNVYRFDCSGNDLINLNVRNTNNINFTTYNSSNNPNLTCIFVDDATYSTANWTDIDPASTFVETEADCSALLSTNSFVLKNSISLSPNPTNGLLTITNNSSFKIKEFEITNLLGQQIVHQKLNSNTIDLSNLENAIYFIKLKDMNGHSASYKIIKE